MSGAPLKNDSGQQHFSLRLSLFEYNTSLSATSSIPSGCSQFVKEIVRESGHCGYWGKGILFAEWLSSEQKEVVVIDKDENALRHMTDHLDIQTLHGSGSNPRVLEDAGVAKSDIILAVTWDEKVNILASLPAKRLGAKKTVARVNKFAYIPLVHAIGIDRSPWSWPALGTLGRAVAP